VGLGVGGRDRARLRLDPAKAVSGLILADAVVSCLGCAATAVLCGLVSSGVSDRAVCTLFFVGMYFPSYFGSAVNALIAVLRCAIVARSDQFQVEKRQKVSRLFRHMCRNAIGSLSVLSNTVSPGFILLPNTMCMSSKFCIQ
jgi:hypothetical protein